VRAKMVLLRRFIQEYGAPAVGRYFVLTTVVPGLLALVAFVATAPGGYLGVLSWILAVNFGLSAVLCFLPYVLSRHFIVRSITNPIATLDTWLRNPKADRLDKRTVAGELGKGVHPEKAVRYTKGMLSVLKMGLFLVSPLYLLALAGLWFSMPPEADAAPRLELLALALATALALAAFRLFVQLRIDQTRLLLEELPGLQTVRGERQDAIEAGLLVIDTFRENHYRLNLPISSILSQLDAVRLWREEARGTAA
jgi:hypothetical protein